MVAYERLMYMYRFITRQVVHDLRNNLNETENEDTFYEDNLEAFLAHNLRAELAADLTKYSDDQGRKNYLFRSNMWHRTIIHNTKLRLCCTRSSCK